MIGVAAAIRAADGLALGTIAVAAPEGQDDTGRNRGTRACGRGRGTGDFDAPQWRKPANPEEAGLMSADMATPRILVIGTGDTKTDELLFMKACIEASGGRAVMMDVSVLGDPPYSPITTSMPLRGPPA